jgi:hypothetical protein
VAEQIVAGARRDAMKGQGSAFPPCFLLHPYPSPSSPIEMTTLPRFRMKVAPPAPEAPEMTAGPGAPPAVMRLDLSADDPGSFNYDRDSGKSPAPYPIRT